MFDEKQMNASVCMDCMVETCWDMLRPYMFDGQIPARCKDPTPCPKRWKANVSPWGSPVAAQHSYHRECPSACWILSSSDPKAHSSAGKTILHMIGKCIVVYHGVQWGSTSAFILGALVTKTSHFLRECLEKVHTTKIAKTMTNHD